LRTDASLKFPRPFKINARNLMADAGVPCVLNEAGGLLSVFFTDRPVVDYRATLTADRDRIKRFNQELVRRHVVKAVNKIYVSIAHTDADVDETLTIFDEVLAMLARAA
jgi:glutamate-1-semialdehyde 2,1-aminomutase